MKTLLTMLAILMLVATGCVTSDRGGTKTGYAAGKDTKTGYITEQEKEKTLAILRDANKRSGGEPYLEIHKFFGEIISISNSEISIGNPSSPMKVRIDDKTKLFDKGGEALKIEDFKNGEIVELTYIKTEKWVARQIMKIGKK